MATYSAYNKCKSDIKRAEKIMLCAGICERIFHTKWDSLLGNYLPKIIIIPSFVIIALQLKGDV